MDVTDVVGGFGPWQKTILAVIVFRAVPLSFIGSAPLLYVTSTDHWCARPHNVTFTPDEWKNLAIPTEGGTRSHCRHYAVTVNQTGHSVVDANRTVACNEWDYDQEYGNTVIKEFNLVCDDRWLVPFTHTALKVGNLIGFLPAGYVTDRFGRKTVSMWSFAAMLICNTVAAFSPTYMFYVAIRFIIGLLYTFAATASLCLLLEVLGPDHRKKVSYSFIGGWGVGMMITPAIYWLDQDWKHNQLILSIPFTLAILALLWRLVPESVRWLLTTQQDDRAEEIIEVAAKKNKVQLDSRDVYMTALKDKIFQERVKTTKSPSYLDLLRHKDVRKWTIALSTSYFIMAFVYFGYLMTLQSLGANMFLTIFLMGLTEVLAVGIFVLSNRFRRKPALIFLSLFTAAAYLATIPVPDSLLWLRLLMSMAGRLTNIVMYNLIWMISAEVFPTSHRTLGVNGCMAAGRVGTVVSTFLVSVAQAVSGATWLLVLYGVLMGLSSLLYLLLPETKDKHLPDTMVDTKLLAKAKLAPDAAEIKPAA